jgi:hypothetical protein
MKELIKPNQELNVSSDLEFHCETYDCSGCQEATCNKNCKNNPTGNISSTEDEDILF